MLADGQTITQVQSSLNSLAAGLFLVTAFGIVAERQVSDTLSLFVAQSVFVAAAAFIVGGYPVSSHLMALGAIILVSKVFVIPFLLRSLLREEVYRRREVTQVMSVQSSLLIALALTTGAYIVAWSLSHSAASTLIGTNVPVGLGVLLVSSYTLVVRREAVPQLLALLAMENGALVIGIAVAPHLPLVAELALAMDVLLVGAVVGVLVRLIHEQTGTTHLHEAVNPQESLGNGTGPSPRHPAGS